MDSSYEHLKQTARFLGSTDVAIFYSQYNEIKASIPSEVLRDDGLQPAPDHWNGEENEK